MKKYVKPNFFTTEFEVNEKIAAGCDRVVTSTESTKVFPLQTVYCEIGNQNETIFNSVSGCDTAANKYAIVTEGDTDYLIWYTYSGDMGNQSGPPDASETAILDRLVASAGFSTGSGWHYTAVTSTIKVTDILGFSY